MNRFDNIDCMLGMKDYPDKYFDLAIVDPPYGINAGRRRGDTGKNKHILQKDYRYGEWDSNRPSIDYFNKLFRISKNQIIWGGNYYLDLIQKATSCFIVWDKLNGDNLYADCELVWTSFDSAVRKFEYMWFGFLQQNMKQKEERIHPTQKPIALYKWLLTKYAKRGDKILDTHIGSASSLIACEDLGFEYVGFEIDKDYYEAAQKRLKQYRSQLKLAI